jgi:hypothetical protein
VPGEPELHVHSRAVGDRDRLVHDTHGLPPPGVLVLVGVVGVGPVDVEVLLVDREDGQPERDVPVVADGHPRQRGFPGSDDVEAGCAQVHQIAQRGQPHGAMRVVGQQRPAGGAAARADHPVVAALRVGPRPRRAGAERRRGGGQPVDVEHVVGDEVEIEAVGHP